ncbi:MAG: molecular chaperone DnaJ [Thermoleophilaceae bacterium]|jgi:molecular chaperone DnaJ|nr:molecular chaperone DnaJ [Thermoleophilaceae bacterium]
MAQNKDPYQVLGVAKKASDDEIKKAYRKLARQYHPDRNPDDASAEERFKEVQEAYSVLSDPEKRKQFDSGGLFGTGFDPSAFRGGAGGQGFGGFGDLFSDLFGGGGPGAQRGRPQRGRDLETDVTITFDQAMNGTQVSLSVPIEGTCATCHGNGAKPGTTPRVCPRCNGRGIEAQGQGLFSISQPCRECGGRGSIVDDPCPTCGGRGVTQQVKRYKANIPAGVREGTRVRLAGKGEPGPGGGPSGDLYVITHVGASPVFARKGDNLEVEVPISIVEAIRGATVEVPTLSGTKRIRVPAGTQHGTVQRLRGEGPQRLGGKGRGDIHYRLNIDVPKSLSSEQEKAVDDLAGVMSDNPRENLFGDRGEG